MRSVGRGLLGGTVLAAAVGGAVLTVGAPLRAQPGGAAATPAQDGSPGATVYAQNCAVCHNNAEQIRAPNLGNLHALPASQIRFALTQGVMQAVGSTLSAPQKEAVIAWLAAPEPPAAEQAAKADAQNRTEGRGSTSPAPGPAGHGAPTATAAAHGSPALPAAGASADPATLPLATAAWIAPLRCGPDHATVDAAAAPVIGEAGVELSNARRLSATQAGLNARGLSDMDVAWTLAFPGGTNMRVTPVIVGRTLFYVSPQPGLVMALDAGTGCVKWARASTTPFRGSPAYGHAGRRPALFVADTLGQVRALDPATGETMWSTDPRYDKSTMITGGLVAAGDKLIVPISASDVARAMSAQYVCCTGHGTVAALDTATGKLLWTAHTMETAKPLGRKNAQGTEMYGPSGAPIWNTPAVDLKAGLVYTGTGENTSPPNTKTSDAILALDLNTGALRWSFQALERDIWNMSCHGGKSDGPNCFFTANGESVLKDFDFGAGPILAQGAGGRPVVLAGQKSGNVWALDPAKKGAVLWSKRFGEGTALGGVHWGMASDGRRLFAPISDPGVLGPGSKLVPGLHALDVATGAELWSWSATPDCDKGRGAKISACTAHAGLSAAPLVVDTALVTGSLDGKVRVFDTATGRVLWTYDTVRDYPSRVAGGVAGRGGSIDAQSIAAGDGMLFVGSGYGMFNQQAGNVLIAFKPKASATRIAQR